MSDDLTPKRGRKTEWTAEKQLALRADVRRLLESGEARSERAALQQLEFTDAWKHHSFGALKRQLHYFHSWWRSARIRTLFRD